MDALDEVPSQYELTTVSFEIGIINSGINYCFPVCIVFVFENCELFAFLSNSTCLLLLFLLGEKASASQRVDAEGQENASHRSEEEEMNKEGQDRGRRRQERRRRRRRKGNRRQKVEQDPPKQQWFKWISRVGRRSVH